MLRFKSFLAQTEKNYFTFCFILYILIDLIEYFQICIESKRNDLERVKAILNNKFAGNPFGYDPSLKHSS